MVVSPGPHRSERQLFHDRRAPLYAIVIARGTSQPRKLANTPSCLSLLRQLGGLYLRELAGQTVQEGHEIPLFFVCQMKALQVRILP